MKKILFVLLMLLIPCVGGALTMCVRDSSLVVSLDQSIGGSTNGNNAAEMLWWTEFSYGRIYGEATCLSEAEGGKPSGSVGVITNVDGVMLSQDLPAGLKNKDADGNDRGYCWCRMTHPASSRWVFFNSSSASYCASFVLTAAVAAPRLMPRCGPGCSGRSANDVTEKGPMAKTQFLLWAA